MLMGMLHAVRIQIRDSAWVSFGRPCLLLAGSAACSVVSRGVNLFALCAGCISMSAGVSLQIFCEEVRAASSIVQLSCSALPW